MCWLSVVCAKAAVARAAYQQRSTEGRYRECLIERFCRLVDGQPIGGPCSRLEKMKAALLLHLPKGSESTGPNADICSRLARHIQCTWGIALGLQSDAASETCLQPALQREALVKQDGSNTPQVPIAFQGHAGDKVNLDTAAAATAVSGQV